MRTRISTIMLAAMIFMAAGCSEDNVPDADGNLHPGTPDAPATMAGTAVTVHASVGGMEKRAGHGSDNLPGKFIFNFAAEGGNKYTGVVMTHDAVTGQYLPSETMTWGTESREATVSAWSEPLRVYNEFDDWGYPGRTVRVAYDQTTADSIRVSDFLCASTTMDDGGVTVNGDVIDLTFLHVFSKVDIRCHLGNDLTLLYPDARICKVEIDDVFRGGYFDFNYGTIFTTDNERLRYSGKVVAYLNAPDAATGDVIAEAIMVPQYFEYGKRPSLIVTLARNGVEKTMPATLIDTSVFAVGCRYTMTVNIGNDVVVPGEVTAQPWAEGDTWPMETE